MAKCARRSSACFGISCEKCCPEKEIKKEGYVLMNAGNKFICKRQGKVYVSDTDVHSADFYQHKANAENLKTDKAYWDIRKIDIDSFEIVKVELSIKAIKEN